MNDELLGPELLASTDQTQVLQILTERIMNMLQQQPEHLMSMLYRLDIDEKKIRLAIDLDDQPARAIANLVLERQLERMQSKAKYKQEPLDDMPW